MLRRQSNAVSPAPSPSASRKSSVVISNVQRISQSSSVQSTAPNQALPKDQKNVCKFAGLLFPVYLAPFIFQGSPESLCLYSVLLPLCSWATGLMSSCAAGMTLMVTLPTLGLMSAEEAAQAFLGPSSLSVVILLVIVTAGYTGGSIIPRLSFKVCSKFGLRVRPLFLWLMALTYVMSLFLDKTVVTALLTLAVDSMLTCIYDCELGSKVMDDVDLRASTQANKNPDVPQELCDSSGPPSPAVLPDSPSFMGSEFRTAQDSTSVGSTSGLKSSASSSVTTVMDSPTPVASPASAMTSVGSTSGLKSSDSSSVSPAIDSPTPVASPASTITSENTASNQLGDKPLERVKTTKLAAASKADTARSIHTDNMESSQGIPLWLRKKSSPNTGKAIDALEPASKEGGGRKRARKSRSRRQSDAKKMENSSRTPAKKKRDRRVKSPSLASTPEKSKHSSKRHNKRTHVAVPQTPTSKEASDPQPSVVAEATANEEEGSPVVPSRVDVRRPSILKPRPRAMSWVPQLLITGIGCSPPAPRTPTVGFGPAECRSISDLTLETTYDKSEKVPHASDKQQQTRLTIEQPDQEPWKQGTVEASRGSPSHSESGVVPSPATAARSSGSALAKAPITNPGSRRTSTTSILRRDSAISLQCVPTSDGTASPTKGSISWLGQKASDGTFASSTVSPKGDNLANPLSLHDSLRTALLLCCSLVTMTSSLSSSLTVAAREALLQHGIIKRGMKGALGWFLLVTPTALLATATCCLPLYMMHLRNRPLQGAESTKDICVAATTVLNMLGPVRRSDLVTAYFFVSYMIFVLLGQFLDYSTWKLELPFLSVILLLSAVIPADCHNCLDAKRRLVDWTTAARGVPWAVVLIYGTVQLATGAVLRYRLLTAVVAKPGLVFWERNTRLFNQVLFGIIGSLLAEALDNGELSADLLPLIVGIAEKTSVPVAAYAVPATVGASCNILLPIQLPMILTHEVMEVPMLQILCISSLAKTVIIATSILSVNTYGHYLVSWEVPTPSLPQPPNSTTFLKA